MSAGLLKWAEQRQVQVAWGPKELVEAARRQVARRLEDLELNDQFYLGELEALIGGEGNEFGQRVVIVALPRPAHLVHFEFEDRLIDALLPPTYFRYRAMFEEVRADLAANGLPGARVEILSAPLKAIACALGLVSYGRNNISYVAGVGSYFQLCGYLTDAILPDRPMVGQREASMLPECTDCGICASVCPTGAISADRVLIHAERCLTLANERPGDWPEWVRPADHSCLLGCLECQRACPANPELPVEDTGLRFSSTETKVLMSGASLAGNAETGIRAKLAWLGQTYAEPVLGRNMAALVHAHDAL